MRRACRSLALLALALAAPACRRRAAPQGSVVVAQGVDPTTLDPMNHQETPAANLARNMFDTLLERDQNLVIAARPRRRAAQARGAHGVGVQAPPRREVPQRRAARRGGGEVQPGAPRGSQAQAPRRHALRAHQPRRGGGPAHRAHPHQGAVADPGHPHVAARGASILPPEVLPREGARPRGPEPGGLGAVQVRALGEGRPHRARGQRAVLAGRARGSSGSSSSPFPTTPCGWPRSRTARSTWR